MEKNRRDVATKRDKLWDHKCNNTTNAPRHTFCFHLLWYSPHIHYTRRFLMLVVRIHSVNKHKHFLRFICSSFLVSNGFIRSGSAKRQTQAIEK